MGSSSQLFQQCQGSLHGQAFRVLLSEFPQANTDSPPSKLEFLSSGSVRLESAKTEMPIKMRGDDPSPFLPALPQCFPSRICWIIASQTEQQLHLRRRPSSAAELAAAAPAELSTKEQNPSFPLLLQPLRHTSAVAKLSF